MIERVRCGVIGAGGIGLHHLRKFAEIARATVVAISESNSARAKTAADKFKITRIYSDYREMLDQPDIEAVTIALPNYLHAQVAIEALEARKHVFLEKPMAMNAKEAMKIVETAKRMKRVLIVSQHLRFDKQTQMARMAIERGELGDIYHAHCFWLRRWGIPRIGSWFTRKDQAGGGCAVDIGIHVLDACLYLLGEFQVQSVCAQTYSKLGPQGVGGFDWGKSEIDPKKPFDVDDFSLALLRLPKGRTVLFQASWAAFHPGDAREMGIDILGAKAGLSLFPARVFRSGNLGYESIQLNEPVKYPYPLDRFEDFINCIIDGKKPLVTMEQSVQVQRILDAIYTSAEQGKEIKLS